jgi:hypothetical protein
MRSEKEIRERLDVVRSRILSGGLSFWSGYLMKNECVHDWVVSVNANKVVYCWKCKRVKVLDEK